MDLLNILDLSSIQLISLIIAAFMVGFSKTGVNGVTMLIIPIMAGIFGGKESTGVLLPMLVAGDIFAVSYYRRHAQWDQIKKLLPWALAGLTLGALVGNMINDAQFKALIALIVIVCLGILLYTERKGNMIVPAKPWLSAVTGTASGFTSMIGNAAGPVFSIYLLARGFNKYGFMGITAWFFMIINLIKVPLQVFVWHNITLKSFLTAGLMLPFIALGAFIGIIVVKKLNEKVFRYLIIVLTAISALRLLL